MSTPVSGSAPYCSGDQFLVWYDARTVAECLSDTDQSIDVTQVSTNPELLSILQAASGKVESVAMMSNMYTPTDLAGLTGNMALFLARLVADLAAPDVVGRRFMEFPDFVKRHEEAEGFLKALLEKKAIFGDQEVMDAGTIHDHVETASDVEQRDMITLQASPFFGRRANRNAWR